MEGVANKAEESEEAEDNEVEVDTPSTYFSTHVGFKGLILFY